MTQSKLIRKLFHLKDLIVKDFWFENYNREIVLSVAPHKCGARCPECGKRGKIIHTLNEPRKWRDLWISGTTIFLQYTPREIKCKTHGRLQEQIPWADRNYRITYRLQHQILVSSQIMTQKSASHIQNIPPSTFSDHLHNAITKFRSNHKIRGLKSIGVDEISYCKGRKYATVVYNLDTSKVVWVSKGKGRETIDYFFKYLLSEAQRKSIKFACCDMARSYLGALKEFCPNAKLVIDKFHIVKALNEAIDELRKQEWRNLQGEDKKQMKGLRWLLFKHSSHRSKAQTRVLNSLKKSNRRIHRAWVLKDEFEAFWNYSYLGSAKSFLKGWITAAKRSRMEPLKKFASTLQSHMENILTYIGTGITNAVSEGVNRVIRFIKNRASGFKSFEAFTDIIYLVIGDLNIPNKIAPKHRTLKI